MAGTWASTVTQNSTVTPSNVVLALDAPGVAGNSAPVSYVSGLSTSKIIFPEVYSGLNAMSICTVTRYTSPTLNRARIFQPFRSTANWLHGQWSGYSGVACASLRVPAVRRLRADASCRRPARRLQRLAAHVAGYHGDGVGVHLHVLQRRH